MGPLADSDSAFERHTLEVRRSARVCVAGGEDPSLLSEVWVACHGYKQLAHRFVRRLLPIATQARKIVAPEALSRFYLDSDGGRHGPTSIVGATWMTREDRENEIADYVHYLDLVNKRFSPKRDVLRVAFGFSQGVHTVARWSVMGSTPVDRLILWGAYIPPDLDLERHADRWRAMTVIQVHGDDDPTRSSRLAEEQADRLSQAGLKVEQRRHRGGHQIDRDLLMELAN